jgi:transaldolase
LTRIFTEFFCVLLCGYVANSVPFSFPKIRNSTLLSIVLGGSKMTNLHKLADLRQSIWFDYIRRSLITSGGLQALIDSGVRGVTSNPSIFEKAVVGSSDYDEDLKKLVAEGKSVDEIYWALVMEDVGRAADLLRPVYNATGGADGYVSLEVDPALAHDADGTIAEAQRLFAALGRPNVMIKVPATPEGMPAIETLISEGINVNVTLIFSLAHYQSSAEAYIAGLEKLAAAGRKLGVPPSRKGNKPLNPPLQKGTSVPPFSKGELGGIRDISSPLSQRGVRGDFGAGGIPGEDMTRVASVASLFVSRMDTVVDKALEEIGEIELQGKIAIANAKMVYVRFLDIFSGARWERLAAQGARVQRPLWASTSTKNPLYSDTLYVNNLIGPNTVNTLPPNTLEAFLDHGRVKPTVQTELNDARAQLSHLSELGIDLEAITQQLQDDGVAAFAKSFDGLVASIAEKREQLLADQQNPH